MKMITRCGMVLALIVSLCGGAARATDSVSNSRELDARVVRIKLSGLIDLVLKQGPTPLLLIVGERELVEQVSSEQNGDTLHIGNRSHASQVRGRHLRAELTLPALREICTDGVGSTTVRGFSGDQLDLLLDGAGTTSVRANYRHVRANLGGLGNLNLIDMDAQQVALNLHGAGAVNLAGRSRVLAVNMHGIGALAAHKLVADSVSLELGGMGDATVYAREAVTLNVSGMGSATVYGKPGKRNANIGGLGTVRWK